MGSKVKWKRTPKHIFLGCAATENLVHTELTGI